MGGRQHGVDSERLKRLAMGNESFYPHRIGSALARRTGRKQGREAPLDKLQ